MIANDGKMGAGYFKIKNNSDKEIHLVGIDSSIAKKQEIHEVVEENDVYIDYYDLYMVPSSPLTFYEGQKFYSHYGFFSAWNSGGTINVEKLNLVDEEIRKKNFKFWQEVMNEDVKAIEGMQKGRVSPAYNGGNFSPVMDTPTLMFHRWVVKNLTT